MWQEFQRSFVTVIFLIFVTLCLNKQVLVGQAELTDEDPAGEFFAFKALLDRANRILDYWCYPLRNARVISNYGGARNHQGVALKPFPNDTIVAAFDGVVTRVGYWGAYGQMVEVQHTRELKTLYAHNSKNLVTVGQVVQAGDPLGLEGQTGRATTQHLHFEVFYNNRKINPAIMFDHEHHELKDSIPLKIGENG